MSMGPYGQGGSTGPGPGGFTQESGATISKLSYFSGQGHKLHTSSRRLITERPVMSNDGSGDQSTPKQPSIGGTIWKAADYLLEKELLKFALEHRQVFTDNEPANARLATDGSSRLTKSEMWKDCANYLNTVVLDNIEKFGSYTAMITHGDASQKFRNLKKTYLQKKAKSRETGKNEELKAMRHYQAFSDLYSPIQIENIETMHYSLPTATISSGNDDDDETPQSNVLAQMLLNAQPNILDNLSRFNLLKGIAQPQASIGFKKQLGSPTPQPGTQSTTTTSTSSTIPELQSQVAINLLMKISSCLEDLRQESRNSWTSLEEQLIKQNTIMDKRNDILEEQRKIEQQRFELEKKRFELECEQRDSHQMQS